MTQHYQGDIAVIGAGNMASAIVRGCLSADNPPVPSDRWIVVARSDARAHQWSGTGVRLRPSVASLADDWDGVSTVILAVKPQMLDEVARDADGLDFTDRVLISILAGSTIERITGSFTNLQRVIRAMPNTPLRVGKGITALCPSDDATDDERALALSIFGSAGETIDLPEDLFDAFTALAGSGPAYLFYLAEAMLRAAADMGFDDEQSRAIVARTLLGGATLLEQSGDDPAHLRANVTSKAGTTHAATAHMDEQGVLDAVRAAVVKARDRGRELAAE